MRIYVYILLLLCIAFQLNAQLVINEISYNSPESNTDSLEYIELYNAGTEPYDLTGYYFLGISDTLHGVQLLPGQFFVTAVSASAMMNVFGVNVHEWSSGGLNNSGEKLVLYDAVGNVVDSVLYDDGDPWPSDADGFGPSLELKDALSDNNNGANWQVSGAGTGVILEGYEVFGTPGAQNSSGGTGGGPAITVDIQGLVFVPRNVVIELGDSVRWINNAAVPHNVNGQQSEYPSNTSSFYSGAPANGPWQYDYEFNATGLNNYHCDVHESMNMRGTVSVYDPNAYTPFPLEHLRLTDGVNGQHIFTGVPTTVTGVVHGINFQPPGYSFYIIDDNNVGINVFSFDEGAYTVTEGDELTINGTITSFNGLLEIVPEEIIVNSTGNLRVDPIVVNEIVEELESSYVKLELYTVDSVVATGTTGHNIYVTTQLGNQVIIRADADSGFEQDEMEGSNIVWGVGTQFDGSFPFTDGYQILALDFGISIGFPILEANSIKLQPNPANQIVTFDSDYTIKSISVFTVDGKQVLHGIVNGENFIDVHGLANGLYVMKVMTNEGLWSSHLVVQH